MNNDNTNNSFKKSYKEKRKEDEMSETKPITIDNCLHEFNIRGRVSFQNDLQLRRCGKCGFNDVKYFNKCVSY